ncbi:MAG TPA: methionine--tRNA ligase [Candidatus Marinimicrobia bacterium]|jgi:methionyl-tRNA synthetase|nr:methionine--tRNA ligase [Candidatus Neomarinimicrobiota bacterium]MDP6276213.1 methionine--tRNA ligase [Candidatus Neomarinimicrobiota bacterium]MDP7217487.1 methionine--tRNA ligase [Candidatus Neomarinimicrobiota bacterium]HBN45617.1 methionine--tRNA ligase [Candidatus Neomarinimicrobiota bacterium]HJL75247.1 methionine--tRNA ligase [Candidatus Neomarinimicrobiota bacterium]
MADKFYITTPIYYVNDKPHIGHAYTTILADVLARYHKAEGNEVFFLTGLDEHGQKVQQAAEERGVSPKEHCDEMAPRFLELWEKLHIENDDFIRTTEGRHVKVVQDILQTVFDNGDIYEDEYEGLYSVSEERFITEKEAESGEFRDIKKLQEKNYFFKMSKYQQALIDHINDNPNFIQPEHRKNEVLGFLRKPLGDLCISRPKSRLNWGIDLPFDNNFVTYVWFDALINYVTAAGFGVDDESYNKWWPCEYHLIGKDILTTHAVYWPTMLMSAKMPLPKSIFAHGWWLSGESKMSKSLGNVVNPLDLIEEYGVDPVRYYLMREMVLGQDASFTMESFIKRYNSDLANDYGNLLSRVTKLIQSNFGGIVPDSGKKEGTEQDVIVSAERTISNVQSLINAMKVNEAIEETLQFIRGVNKYMEDQAPWKLVKENKDSAGRVLYTAAEALRIGTLLLSPVMPHRTGVVLETFKDEGKELRWGKLAPGTELQKHTPLFPRINIKKEKTPKVDEDKNTVTYEDFKNLGLKTAEVLSAEKVEGADKLFKLQIKLGDEERQIVAGIAEHYSPEELIGKMIVVVSNLEPAKIRGVESKGMLLAASRKKDLSLIVVDKEKVSSGKKAY